MGTPRNLYGLGFSPLSIKNKAHSFNEEMLANKDIGLTAYMMDDKVISAEFIARVKAHLEQFIDRCIRDNTIGEVYNIRATDDLVMTIQNSGNIFDNTVEYTRVGYNNKPNVMRFDIDFDCFNLEDSVPADISSLRVKIEFTMDINGTSKNYYLDETLKDLAEKAFKLDWEELENMQVLAPEPEPEPEPEPVVDPIPGEGDEPVDNNTEPTPTNDFTDPADNTSDPTPTDDFTDPVEEEEPEQTITSRDQFVYTLKLNTFEFNLSNLDTEKQRLAVYDILFGLA